MWAGGRFRTTRPHQWGDVKALEAYGCFDFDALIDCRFPNIMPGETECHKLDKFHSGAKMDALKNIVRMSDFKSFWDEVCKAVDRALGRTQPSSVWKFLAEGHMATIGIFCKEGKHRSVAVATLLQMFANCPVAVRHVSPCWTEPGPRKFCGYVDCPTCNKHKPTEMAALYKLAKEKQVRLNILG